MQNYRLKFYIFWVITVIITISTIFFYDFLGIRSVAISAIKYKLGVLHLDKEVGERIVGNVRIEILDNRNICVIGTYSDFLQKRFEIECKGFLKGLDSPIANLKEWTRNVFYNIMGAEIILKYRPIIARAYQNYGAFEISGGMKVKNAGYWINPIGQADFPDFKNGRTKFTKNAEVAHFTFLEFEEPMQEGEMFTLKTPLGENLDFSFSQNVQNKIIKLNQLGYSPNARKKYAYIGAWRGTLGALNLDLDKKPFEIVNILNGATVYKGVISKRQSDSIYKTGTQFTGEHTYQADFSSFSTIGRYKIRITNLGESMPFEISNNAIGEAFYIHAKGLYHKRCGIAKKQPYTNWISGECHKTIYKSNFPPNNRHYKISKTRKDCGFFDFNGNQIEVKHFTLISLNAKTDTTVEACGGWHDAADYDRRPYHYDVVCDLLASFIYRPQNFIDNQLNIPESNNGIPDILDEAIWGMKLWLNLQNSDGSVGGWIEANSHPKEYNPHLDKQPYFLSASTRESTMQYAAHASMLALALKNASFLKESQKWTTSAIKAFEWASKVENRFSAQYVYPTNDKNINSPLQKITYKESSEIPSEYYFKAAFNLYLLTSENRYLDDCKKLCSKMPQDFIETSWRINPFLFCEFLKYGSNVDSLSGIYDELKKKVLQNADMRLEWLENAYPYRIAWYPSNHGFVSHTSWGNYHPFRNAKYFVNAYEITNDKKYRDAVYLCNDFHNGANPTGQTMTSGLGKIYPVKFLDLPSYSDGISEYVLGITPYRNTFGLNREALKIGYALIYSPRKDRNFNPIPTMLFPKSVVGEYKNIEDFSKKIAQLLPIWRRFTNVEAYSVAVSEYTVSETISPAAAVCGWLLDEAWVPSEDMKNIRPSDNHRMLEGYAPLP